MTSETQQYCGSWLLFTGPNLIEAGRKLLLLWLDWSCIFSEVKTRQCLCRFFNIKPEHR